MEGLEIIERIAIQQIPDSVLICIMFGVFSALVPTFIVYLLTKNYNKALATEIISFLVYMLFACALLASGVFKQPTGEYKYRVRIAEDVSYTELTEQYDVITKNDDGTYIIQEKSN